MRIIAGEWRGRKLDAPTGDTTRPTADRTRETLFSMLASRLGSFEGLKLTFVGDGNNVARTCVEAMAAMALALNLDPAFVGAHHILRILGLNLISPVWLRITR